MRKPFISGLAAVSLALATIAVFAAGDTKYPASAFQPKVIFADEALTAKKTPFDAKYPAASFTPEVIYADSKLILEAKTAVKKPVRKIEFDPRYPAAHFEPKVIYP